MTVSLDYAGAIACTSHAIVREDSVHNRALEVGACKAERKPFSVLLPSFSSASTYILRANSKLSMFLPISFWSIRSSWRSTTGGFSGRV